MRGVPIGSQASLAPMLTALLLCIVPNQKGFYTASGNFSSVQLKFTHSAIQRGSLKGCIVYNNIFITK